MSEEFRRAIEAIAPDLASKPLTLLNEGWDSAAVEGGGFVFKFPKHTDAIARLKKEVSLLAMVRRHVELPVPDMVLHEGPPLISRHRIITGEYLLADGYAKLDEKARDRLAAKVGKLHAQLHAIPLAEAEAAGAAPIEPWLTVVEIREKGREHLPPELVSGVLEPVLDAYEALPPDDTIYGYFDGHGWNMAFDHDRQELNGVYDFADSGFGRRHQDLGYSAFISPDLTARVVAHYREMTGIDVDLNRVLTLHGTLRLWEFALLAEDPEHRDQMLAGVAAWHRSMQDRAAI